MFIKFGCSSSRHSKLSTFVKDLIYSCLVCLRPQCSVLSHPDVSMSLILIPLCLLLVMF